MNAQEFKTWFAGFASAIDGVPTQAQWDEIKAEHAKIVEQGLTQLNQLIPAAPRCATEPYRFTPQWVSCDPIPSTTITCARGN